MALTIKDSGGNFTPAPEGTHLARCIQIIDLGTQAGSELYPRARQKCMFVWELPHEQGLDAKPATVSRFLPVSMHEKSSMRQMLESWRGRKFTDDERKGFELRNVVGAPCMVTIVHNDKGRANVQSVTGVPKGTQCPPASVQPIYYEIEDGENDVFTSLSDGIKNLIRKAPEFSGERFDDGHPPPHDDTDIPF